ncbi:hypothetical protein [Priestia megaterium]
MLTLTEKQQLQKLLNYLNQQQQTEEVMEYPYQENKKRNHLDVSQRPRDEKGRFLPYEYMEMEELNWTSDEPEVPRKLKIEPITGSYNSYNVNEKSKRDWSGNIYLLGLLGILIITYLT